MRILRLADETRVNREAERTRPIFRGVLLRFKLIYGGHSCS